MLDGRRATIVMVAATVLGLGASFALKEPCLLNDWHDGFQYRHYCYSDILPLYHRFHLDDEPPRLPYLVPLEELHGTPIEYPVLTGIFAWGVAAATGDMGAYMHLTHLLLLGAGAAVAWALRQSGADWRRVTVWGAGPAVIVHGLTNWDLLAVALAATGWWAWTRDRPVVAALLFGLGGAAKLYPAFFLPYLGLALLRRRDWRGTGQVALGGFAGLGLPNLAVFAVAPTAWMDVWRFHSDREPDWETPYEVLRVALGGPDDAAWHAFVANTSLLLLAAAAAILVWWLVRRNLDPLAAGALLTLAFLLVNRVYSPQYTLWALPLLLLLRVPWVPIAVFLAADLAVFLLRYPTFSEIMPLDHPVRIGHGLAVAARWAALAWATGWLVRRLWNETRDVPQIVGPSDAGSRPPTPDLPKQP